MSFFAKAMTNAPIPANVANTTPVEIVLSNMPSAVICPVMVVPMFAP